jgi:hypothetical protein
MAYGGIFDFSSSGKATEPKWVWKVRLPPPPTISHFLSIA